MNPTTTPPRPFWQRLGRALVIAALLALTALGVGAALFWTVGRLPRAVAAVQACLDRRSLGEAGDLLETALARWPDESQLHFLAARVARLDGDRGVFAYHLKEFRRLGGDPERAGLEEALFQAQLGHVEPQPEPLGRHLAEGDPDRPYVLEALAEGYEKDLQPVRAVHYYTLWLRDQPEAAILIRSRRAEAFIQYGFHDDALEDFRRVLELDPNRDTIRLRMAGLLLAVKSDAEGALPQFQRVAKARPEDPYVLLGLGACYRLLGRRDQARALLDRLLAAHPDQPGGLINRGKLAVEDGEPWEAEKLFRRAVAADPSDYQANYQLFLCLQRQGKAAEAARYDAVCRKLSRFEQALQELGRPGADKGPEAAARFCRTGLLCLELGKTANGLRYLERALRLDPGYRPAHQALADYYERAGDAVKAREHRRAAKPASPRK